MRPSAEFDATLLDRPLPVELTGTFDSWWTRYRRYPIFSRGWSAGRTKVWGSVALALLALIALGMLTTDEPLDRWWVVPIKIVLLVGLPVLVGPWLGFAIRRRGLAPSVERVALVLALGALAVSAMLSSRYLAPAITDTTMRAFGHEVSTPAQATAQVRIGILVGPEGRTTARAAGTTACPDGSVRGATGSCESSTDEPPDDATPSPVQWATNGTVLFLLAGGLAVFGIRKERDALTAIAREKALAQAQAQRHEAEMRLSVLAAQVEPHFLFNTLAGVRSAIHADPDRASTMVDRLVDYLRASIPKLRDDGAAHATLGQQLDIVRAYLGLMTARMPRLVTRVDADPSLLGHPFPPLMLISLAENAIKHGVEPKVGSTRIDVTARLTDDGRLAVTVADDGVGFAAADTAGSGIGLTNIRERLQQMFAARSALELKARPTGGVAATITVPIGDALPAGAPSSAVSSAEAASAPPRARAPHPVPTSSR